MFNKVKNFWKEMVSEVVISKEKTISMSVTDLKKNAQLLHPVGFYILAKKLFGEGEKDDSIFWFYVGSIRYRYYLSSIGEDPFHPEVELFGKVQFEIGSVILDYAGGDPEAWASQIAEAVQWDKEHLNYFHAKKNDPAALEEIHAAMQGLMDELVGQKDEILRQRIDNGADVRV